MHYWKVPPIWEGGQCVIIGGGHSFPRQFGIPEDIIQKVYSKQLPPSAYSPYLELLHNQHVIAINMAYTLGDWIDVTFFGDGGLLKKFNSDILDFKGLKVTCATGIAEYHKRVRILRRSNKIYGIDFNPTCLGWNFNSGAAAINLAVHFGAKRIILFGYDMQLDENKNQHWHKFYKGNPVTVRATFAKHLKGFPYIANDLKGKVEVINVNPDSKVTGFPKIALRELNL